MNLETAEWIAKAEGDFANTEAVLGDGSEQVPEILRQRICKLNYCFYSHQFFL
jgi:hypothetical protein